MSGLTTGRPEKLLLPCGLLFISGICFVTLFLLPQIDERAHEIYLAAAAVDYQHPKVVPAALRVPLNVERDHQALKDRMDAEKFDAQPPAPIPRPLPVEDTISRRKEFVKNMMRHAWSNYRRFAWGTNELRPITKVGHSASIFGAGDLGATIVDAIDTLWLMDMKEEYKDARDWIADNLDWSTKSKGDISVFETNIRFVGGLLSAYALSNDTMFIRRADEIAQLLLPAFATETGIPLAMINLQTRRAHNWGWASGGCSILSEFGSLQLEFDYLSHVTGKSIYKEKVAKIREVLTKLEKPDGLYPLYLNPHSGKWGQRHYSIGAMGDSFYEYLLKHWLITDKTDAATKEEYDAAMEAIEAKQLLRSQQHQLAYFADMKGTRVEHKMDHLACFSAGMLALQSAHEENSTLADHALSLARELGHTCHESYIRTETGIGPESFRFTSDAEAVAIADRDKYYILRPEAIEAWFYLWRVTKEDKYREWCWDAAQAIERHCRVENGYSGIRNVYSSKVEYDDVQQSFLLAETLKYLYLAFSDDSVVPLSDWVFNTEAHPFPVRRSSATRI